MKKSIKVMMLLILLASPSLPLSAQEAPAGNYAILPGDVLEVSVWKEKDLQREVLVRPDGRFSFLLAGDVDATGKTVEDIRVDITRRLSNRFVASITFRPQRSR